MTHPLSKAAVEAGAKAIATDLGEEDWDDVSYFINQHTDTVETCKEVYRSMAEAALSAAFEQARVEENAQDGHSWDMQAPKEKYWAAVTAEPASADDPYFPCIIIRKAKHLLQVKS